MGTSVNLLPDKSLWNPSGSTMGIGPLVAAMGVAVKFAVRDGSKKWLVASW